MSGPAADPRFEPRYQEIATFMRAPYVPSLEGGPREMRNQSSLNLVGGDVVEVSPPFDPSGNTALVGATIMFELLCLLAEVRAK